MSSSAPPREKPLLVYDGDCGFCRRRVARWQKLTRDRVDYRPYQEAAGEFPQIPEEQFQASVYLVESAGRISRGAEAVFRTMTYAPGLAWMHWMYARCPGVAPLTE